MSEEKELRLAMLGMIEGNGHPYSWSAIVNGYDPAEMEMCPYAGILGPHHVRVNCLAPGGFFNHQPEPFLTRYNEHTMLGRMADERDLGGAVIFLPSDASKYITDANLPVDGGYTAK